VELFNKIALIVRRYFYVQDELAQLEGLSDRHLSDIGLRRGDITDLARAMADQRLAAYAARRVAAPAQSGYVSVLKPAS
jgi:uncharacterized protein YjiS (DUF1127 family)